LREPPGEQRDPGAEPHDGSVRSLPAFLAVAAAVTLAPGPAFALILQTAAVHGRRTALATIAGNSVGVLTWGALSAAGVSALVAASEVAYDTLRLAGAAYLVWLGVQALRPRRRDAAAPGSGTASTGEAGATSHRDVRRAARRGLVNSLANPKLALFFVALFPQFVAPGAAALPAALAMAAVIVTFDVLWYGSVALLVDRARRALRPRLIAAVERVTGAVLLGFGVRLAAESR
jgi:threonine/homoserine/homoserine lactone efflux protein